MRHEGEAFELRLAHKHAVERITVMRRQGARGEGVRQGNRERCEARRGELRRADRRAW